MGPDWQAELVVFHWWRQRFGVWLLHLPEIAHSPPATLLRSHLLQKLSSSIRRCGPGSAFWTLMSMRRMPVPAGLQMSSICNCNSCSAIPAIKRRTARSIQLQKSSCLLAGSYVKERDAFFMGTYLLVSTSGNKVTYSIFSPLSSVLRSGSLRSPTLQTDDLSPIYQTYTQMITLRCRFDICSTSPVLPKAF